ncbi:protein NRDE2 homolog isoform X1 [Sinocyclocheilus anshuiensis]|uniref:protein NRDE2 homolog isoform X1 n=1 Tax=Sinocyclocheilus anshuiensis TaxID=1608454 RepID=UPI0007BA7845|nr:PREDICTED: protein NRDE2 homolog isoform X1 [Sinocyclocheilus anshuiensis]XP_016297610.1 PREDICTED: protein NRDE2 homolog isoform X1 [Sinocyclocheilus anshuiensis]
MALFPSCAELSGNNSSTGDRAPADLEWLSNQSFSKQDALKTHQRATERVQAEAEEPAGTREQKCKEREDSHGRSNKRKKEKKKKQKKKKSRDNSESGGSESDTVYPSDLLKKENADREEAQVRVSETFMWLDDLQTPSDSPFCIDRRADRANWEYKSLYRGDIARYKRKGGSCLGLDFRMQAVNWNDGGPEKKRVDKKPERYFCPSTRQLLRSDSLPALPVLSEGIAVSSDSYIKLSACTVEQGSSTQAPVSWVNPLGIYDRGTSLWLEGKGQPEVKGDQQDVEAQRSSSTLLSARVEEFNRKLRENPTDTQLWLDFIHFQDELAFGSGSFSAASDTDNDGDMKKMSLRAVLEKKLSIVDRAVESNPANVDLKLEKLHLCKELWEPATLQKEWKKLVFIHPNSAPLWRKYLLFTQSLFSTFSVSKVNSVFGKCLSTLSAVQDGSMVSHPPLPGTQEDLLDIFLQQCHFLRQAGHTEKAVCLFQALLDFTFFKPDSVKDLPTRQQVDFFEPFWDSGEPRVGERGARGWKAWMLQQERGGWVIPSEPGDDDDEEEQDDSEIKDKTWPKWKIWLDVEASREANHWLPWRPDKTKGQSEEDCEDPDRQVLFDDIGPSMIRVDRPDLQLQLILSFLQFLGLPGPSGKFSTTSSSNILLDNLTFLEEGPDPERPLTSYDLPMAGICAVGHMTFLSDCRRQAGLCKAGEEFLQNVLQQTLQLISAQDQAAITLCWLQYEKLKVLRCLRSGNKRQLKSQGKRSKRLVKRLLKEPDNRSSLALWREYAHLEWLLGNLEEARKVFDTALGMGVTRGLNDPVLCNLCFLYAQLEVEQALNSGTVPTSKAVYILTKLAEGAAYTPFSGQINPVTILKARKAYEQALLSFLPEQSTGSNARAPKKLHRMSSLVGCFGLFQYLTMGIDAADAVYNQAIQKLISWNLNSEVTDGSLRRPKVFADWESVAVQHVSLLRHHANTSVFPLSRLRLALTDALSLLPSSASLWQLYLQTENRYHSAGRARRFFHSVAKKTDSVVPYLFAITAEQRLKQMLDSVQRSRLPREALPTLPNNGLSNRIRCLFENATATEHGAHCPLLWRMYLNFMVCDGNAERGSGIFYKALQAVPWVKGLYMDAVQLFPERVQEFLDLMTEKELRLRVPMEEVDILLED